MSSSDESSDLEPETALAFEPALARLEAIINQLEEGALGLAESLACYEEGVRLLKGCYGLLEQAERKVELLTGIAPDGQAQTVPLDDTASAPLPDAAARSERRSATRGTSKATKPAAGETPDRPRELF